VETSCPRLQNVERSASSCPLLDELRLNRAAREWVAIYLMSMHREYVVTVQAAVPVFLYVSRQYWGDPVGERAETTRCALEVKAPPPIRTMPAGQVPPQL
jgi:hypothetical protein